MLSPRSVRLARLSPLLMLAVLAACQGRDSIERHDVELDTTAGEDAAQDTGSDPGDLDAADDANATDTNPPEDTAPPPSDIDEGPRELLNGTPVRFGHVIDGDTLDVFVGEQAVKVYTVRLKGLAAPECVKESVLTEKFGYRHQCTGDDELYGLAAWTALRDAVEGKSGVLTCDDVAPGQWCPTDPYDRYLAYIEIDGKDLATELAWYGNAFSYTSFPASRRAGICAAEYSARDNGRGIWQGRTLNQVMDGMHPATRDWYYTHHDSRCDAAIAGQ